MKTPLTALAAGAKTELASLEVLNPYIQHVARLFDDSPVHRTQFSEFVVHPHLYVRRATGSIGVILVPHKYTGRNGEVDGRIVYR